MNFTVLFALLKMNHDEFLALADVGSLLFSYFFFPLLTVFVRQAGDGDAEGEEEEEEE